MNFLEIKKKLNELEIQPFMLADNFESFVEKDIQELTPHIVDENTKWKIDIFNQTIEGTWDEINKKIEDIILLNFGEIDYIDINKRHNEEIYSILHFVEHDVYVRIMGWYKSYSYDYYEESEFEEVIPFQKTITEYKKI